MSPHRPAASRRTEEGRRITELAKARILVPREEGRIARGLREKGLDVTSVMLQRLEVLAVSSTLEGADLDRLHLGASR